MNILCISMYIYTHNEQQIYVNGWYPARKPIHSRQRHQKTSRTDKHDTAKSIHRWTQNKLFTQTRAPSRMKTDVNRCWIGGIEFAWNKAAWGPHKEFQPASECGVQLHSLFHLRHCMAIAWQHETTQIQLAKMDDSKTWHDACRVSWGRARLWDFKPFTVGRDRLLTSIDYMRKVWKRDYVSARTLAMSMFTVCFTIRLHLRCKFHFRTFGAVQPCRLRYWYCI